MYIMITNRCNRYCGHCCFDCNPNGDETEGQDMSAETFRLAIKQSNGYITIGGGEPTLHPLFWEFVGLALKECEESPYIVTNGTRDAIALGRLDARGILAVRLSQDTWHDPISQDVVKAFHRKESYARVYHPPFARGRGALVSGAVDGCACDDTFVDTDGQVYACGCKRLQLGDVETGFIAPPEDYSCKETT